MSQLTAIIIAIICIVANGFFVAAEFAIVKVRGTRIEELAQRGDRRAGLLKHILEHLDSYLSACQLGITVASLGLGWIGEPAVAELIEPVLAWFGVTNPTAISTVAFGIAFSFISFLHIVVGEVAPKSIAVRHPERWAQRVAYPLRWFFWLMFPFIWLVNASALGLLRLFSVEPASVSEIAHSEEELRMIVASSHALGVLDKEERELLDNVFEFGEHTVHEIMVPRTRIACVFAERSFEENMEVVRETMHTRYPLVREDKDNVLGMVHLKDLYLAWVESGGVAPDLESIKREILAVPDTLQAHDLLTLFKKRHIHMAIAVDEYGGTAGLVTLEDLIEELVGEIEDEFDNEEEDCIAESEDTWRVHGNLPIKDLAKVTGQELDEDDVDTVGGLLMLRLNRIPRQGETIPIGGLNFEILRMNAYEVGRVRVSIRGPDEGAEDLEEPDVPEDGDDPSRSE